MISKIIGFIILMIPLSFMSYILVEAEGVEVFLKALTFAVVSTSMIVGGIILMLGQQNNK